jgi:hypothetical protein
MAAVEEEVVEIPAVIMLLALVGVLALEVMEVEVVLVVLLSLIMVVILLLVATQEIPVPSRAATTPRTSTTYRQAALRTPYSTN